MSAPENEVLSELSGRVELQAQLFGGPRDPKVLGVVLNKVRTEESMADFATRLREHSPLLRGDDFRLLGCIPYQAELNAPRTRDVAELLGARAQCRRLRAAAHEHHHHLRPHRGQHRAAARRARWW